MISVIVPVYKVEKYLDRCVRSILTQTYDDFELILVDDGSPDNCPKMCDTYAEKNKNVRVLHKKNGGLSDARNAGTVIAKGEYVTYIDSDDYVNKRYLEILYENIKLYNATISVIGLEKCYEEKVFKESKIKDTSYKLSGAEALCNMLYQKDLDTHAWGVLMPLSMAKAYPFPIGKNHEDEFTTYNYYYNSDNVAVSRAKAYYYLQRKDSIMHTFGKNAYDELDAADKLVEFCDLNAKYALRAANSKKFSDYCQVYLSSKNLKTTNYKMYFRIKNYLISNKNSIIFDKNTRMKNKIAAISLNLGLNGLSFLNFFRLRR